MFVVLGRNCFQQSAAANHTVSFIGRRVRLSLANWSKTTNTFHSGLFLDHRRDEVDRKICWSRNVVFQERAFRFPKPLQLESRISATGRWESQRFYASLHEDRDPFTFNMPKVPPNVKTKVSLEEGEVKMTKFQKLKKMFKEYWYVVVPVHLITSAFWFGVFYYMAVSGVDIVPLLRKIGVSETVIEKLNDSGAGYVAIAYAMFKIASPLRYTVTIGGTTLAITYLRKLGIIKPAPSPAKVHQFLRVKGALFLRRRRVRSKGTVNIQLPPLPPTAAVGGEKPLPAKSLWGSLRMRIRQLKKSEN